MRWTLMAVVILCGCATAPQFHEIQTDYDMPVTRERVWEAVVETFAEHMFDIAEIEQSSGLMTTEWHRISAGQEAAMCDCGSGGLASTVARQVKFNVFVKDLPDGRCRLKITAKFQVQRSFDSNYWWVGCYSRGVLEQQLYDEVCTRAGINTSDDPEDPMTAPSEATAGSSAAASESTRSISVQ